MLSRFALRSLVKATDVAPKAVIRPLSTTASLPNSEERDLVNFPRRTMPRDADPVRIGVFPEEWFTAMATKAGAMSPYLLFTGVATTLISKEIWVFETEGYLGLHSVLLALYINHKWGDKIMETLNRWADESKEECDEIRTLTLESLEVEIEEENRAQWMATSYETLIEAKKENVALQLEAAYRKRLQDAYTQVKKRLDYQTEISTVTRRLEQKHMVNYILDGVTQAITPKNEEEALKKCLTDLKALA